MAEIQGLVFDKDGTLVDFEKTWAPTFVDSARSLAREIGRPEMAGPWLEAVGYDPATDRIGPGTELASGTTDVVASRWRGLSPELPPLPELVAWLDAFWEKASLERLSPVGDVAGLFGALHETGHRLGLVTNDSERSARSTAARLGIVERLDFVVGYDSGHDAKPSPAMIFGFCSAVGLLPSEVAMIGDSPADLAAGRAAGCGALVGVLTGASPAAVLAPLADVVVVDIHALPALLGGTDLSRLSAQNRSDVP